MSESRKYVVHTDQAGEVPVEAIGFEVAANGHLSFRLGPNWDGRNTRLVAVFAAGKWNYVEEADRADAPEAAEATS